MPVIEPSPDDVQWPGRPGHVWLGEVLGWVERSHIGPQRTVVVDPTDPGGYCHWTRRVVYSVLDASLAEPDPNYPAGYIDWVNDGNTAAPCPGQTSLGQAVDADRGTVVDQLPRPVPQVQPDNQAITGLRSWLLTNRDAEYWLSDVHTLDLGVWSVQVRHEATVSSWIDWTRGLPAGPDRAGGFGVTGPHTEAGAPYPDGTITFVYERTGATSVAVTDHWTVRSWVLLPGGWTDHRIQTVALDPVTFEVNVQQAQPVRQR